MGYGIVGMVWLSHLTLRWWCQTCHWILGRLLCCLLDLEQRSSCLLNAYRGQHIGQSETRVPSGPWFGRIWAEFRFILVEVIAGSHWQMLPGTEALYFSCLLLAYSANSLWALGCELSMHFHKWKVTSSWKRSLPLSIIPASWLGAFEPLNFYLWIWISKEEFLLEVENLSLC